jgi:hypothetical protein
MQGPPSSGEPVVGTKVACSIVAPSGPIQFWIVRNSPGVAHGSRVRRGAIAMDLPDRIGQVFKSLEAEVHRCGVVDDVEYVGSLIVCALSDLALKQILEVSRCCPGRPKCRLGTTAYRDWM